MDIHERLQETISRLFGPTARLCGSIGTVDRPGRLEIVVNGVTAGYVRGDQAGVTGVVGGGPVAVVHLEVRRP